MDQYTAPICPKCGGIINSGDNATACPACGVPHHLNCWIANQGCAVPTCPGKVAASVAPVTEQPVTPVTEQPVTPVTEQPVTPVTEQAAYQQPVKTAPSFCARCGTPVSGAFCPKCGQPVGVGVVNPVVAPYGAPTPAQKSKAPLIIGILVGVAVLILIIALIGGSGSNGSGGGLLSTGPNFRAIYNEHCSSTWAEVGSDGSYLSIDTNPFDWEDDGVAYTEAYYAIEEVNEELGLPDSLFEEMGSTRGMDGKQSRTYSDKNLEISWSYHPDKGLEVTYRKIR